MSLDCSIERRVFTPVDNLINCAVNHITPDDKKEAFFYRDEKMNDLLTILIILYKKETKALTNSNLGRFEWTFVLSAA